MVDLNDINFDGGRIAIIKDRKVIIDDVISFFQAAAVGGPRASYDDALPFYNISAASAQHK